MGSLDDEPNAKQPVRQRKRSSPARRGHIDLDLSYLEMDAIPQHYYEHNSDDNHLYYPGWVKSLVMHHNSVKILPDMLSNFTNLVALDISNNFISELPESIGKLQQLRILMAKNNQLYTDSIPKSLAMLRSLEVLNLSGNHIAKFPVQLTFLLSLKALYLGSNHLKELPCAIGDLESLELLYLGGNELRDIPSTIGKLLKLSSLSLCDNKLETIPSSIAGLQRLQSLSLHKNVLKTLPTDIVRLQNLQELSLRGNPLVVRFARELLFEAPSLKELSGRAIKLAKLSYGPADLPLPLISYLKSAHHCVNPKCKGVYFDEKVEHVKFVDFCGKFHIPLMQYICSPRCSSSSTPAYAFTTTSDSSDSSGLEDNDEGIDERKMRKVLLG